MIFCFSFYLNNYAFIKDKYDSLATYASRESTEQATTRLNDSWRDKHV